MRCCSLKERRWRSGGAHERIWTTRRRKNHCHPLQCVRDHACDLTKLIRAIRQSEWFYLSRNTTCPVVSLAASLRAVYDTRNDIFTSTRLRTL